MTVTNISSGITSHALVINSGDILNVQSGGTADGTTVNTGGQDNVLSGGVANDTVLNLGGNESVAGMVTGTTVNNGGTESLATGGAATGTVVNGGGVQLVHAGAVARNTTLNLNANQFVDGTTFNTVVNSGGTESLYNSSVATGSVVNNGGSEFVHAGSITSGVTINNGGSVFLANGAIASGGILFGGGSAKLDISGTVMPATTITGFSITDEIDLGGLVFAQSNTVSVSGDMVTVTGAGGAHETLTIAGAQHDVFKLSAEPDGDNGTKLEIVSAVGNPVVANVTVTVNGNTPAVAIGIAEPTDPNYSSSMLTITVRTLPTDGAVTLADGTTAVITGQVLTDTQLKGLLFTPTRGQFATSSAFTYSVTDPAGNTSNGAATLAINAAVGNPVVSSPKLTVAENAVATTIGIAAPTDPNYTAAQLTIAAGTLPTDGVVTLADGKTAIVAGQALTSAQLTGLLFTPTHGMFASSSTFTYKVTDPSGNATSGAATLAIGPSIGNPVVSSPTVTVAENMAATPIGIAAPTDPNYTAAQLTITAGNLPGDGAVTLADGVTAVVAGEALTSVQLGGLLFTPTHGIFGASSTFTYSVTDPAGNASNGVATLAIGPAIGNPVVSSPMVTVAENAAATAIGIAAPSDPNYALAQLAITAGALPADGIVTLADGVTAVMAGQSLTSAQLTGLLFTPANGQSSASSAFTYNVTDPAGNASKGTATLGIGPAASVLTTPSEIVNTANPVISGTAAAGGTVTLFSGGTVIGTATADAATGMFAVTPTTSLALGLNTLSATVTTAGGTSASSAAISVFDVQGPSNGVSTTDFSSADLGAVLSLGAEFNFIGGTEAVLLTDSTLSVGPDTNEATVQRLYEGLLGRPSDTGGMSTWDAQLTSGVSKGAVAGAFLGSDEYMASHGTQSDGDFVTSLYQGVLGRAPDSDGAAGWMGALAQGAARADVAIDFVDSPEAKSHFASATAQVYAPNALGTLAHELYETGLGREVELAGLASFKAAFASLTPAQIAADIAGSQEFMNDHAGQGNAAYVSSLYQNGLGRAPDAGGAAGWTSYLDNGGSRSDVMLDFATSQEGMEHLTHNLGA